MQRGIPLPDSALAAPVFTNDRTETPEKAIENQQVPEVRPLVGRDPCAFDRLSLRCRTVHDRSLDRAVLRLVCGRGDRGGSGRDGFDLEPGDLPD